MSERDWHVDQGERQPSELIWRHLYGKLRQHYHRPRQREDVTLPHAPLRPRGRPTIKDILASASVWFR